MVISKYIPKDRRNVCSLATLVDQYCAAATLNHLFLDNKDL